MSDFCARESTRLCNKIAPCSCATPPATCVATAQAQCNHILQAPDLLAAISTDTVRWDAAAAGNVIASSYGDGLNCNSVLHPFTFNFGQAGTFEGMLLGTLPPGAACAGTLTDAAIEPCAGGACVAGHCERFADVGEACDDSVVCIDEIRSLAFSDPTPTAICSSGQCVRENAWQGAPCTTGAECASGICSTGSCAGLPAGASCTSRAACESGACATTCVDVVAFAPCTTPDSCPPTLRCNGTVCEYPICGDIAP